jgi:hypothetical protein
MMANPFNITAAANSLRLDSKLQAQTSFTVYNNSGRIMRGRARIAPQDPATEKWLTLAGEAEKDFPIAGTQQYNVQIAVPAGSPPGSYPFRLDVVGTENPDEEFSQGPTVTFEVPAAPPAKKPFPIWIPIVAVVALLVVGGVIAFLATRDNGPSEAEVAASQTATAEAQAAVDATSTALAQVPATSPTATPTPGPLSVRVTFNSITIHDRLEDVNPGQFVLTLDVNGVTRLVPPSGVKLIAETENVVINEQFMVSVPAASSLSIKVSGFEQDSTTKNSPENDIMGIAQISFDRAAIEKLLDANPSTSNVRISGTGGHAECQARRSGCFTAFITVTKP